MNTLETFIVQNSLNENDTMNLLQSNAIISDNCISAADVYETDCSTAIEFLTFLVV